MEALLNNIPDYIYFKDLESRFLRINKALSQVFGLNDTLAAIGKSDVDFFEKEHSLETYHDEQTIIKTGIPIIGKEEIQVCSERPTLWVSTTKMPLKDSAGKIIGTFGVSRDITEIKKFQDELLKAKEKAEESDVLKTAFIQNISHEIRTPLNAITGFASFLVKPDLPTEKKMEFIRIINLSCDQLISVITGIISLSTLDAGQEKIIEKKTTLNALLKDIYNQFIINHECEKVTLSYHSDLSDELSTVIIDSVKLTQILINLVGNALKFTSEGSVKFGFTLSENIIEFFVSDTGIGIPKEMHNLIFERFRQVDNSSTRRYGGNGIGLTISKGYVEMMGGTINVTSNPGSGSLFSFRLPYRPVYN
jgi:PAS domain S-box-containing protein